MYVCEVCVYIHEYLCMYMNDYMCIWTSACTGVQSSPYLASIYLEVTSLTGPVTHSSWAGSIMYNQKVSEVVKCSVENNHSFSCFLSYYYYHYHYFTHSLYNMFTDPSWLPPMAIPPTSLFFSSEWVGNPTVFLYPILSLIFFMGEVPFIFYM